MKLAYMYNILVYCYACCFLNYSGNIAIIVSASNVCYCCCNFIIKLETD